MAGPLYVQFTYRCATDDFGPLETNLKEERVDEVLGEWLRTQLGAGKDDTPAAERKQYAVRIELDLADDSFAVKSDTGNKGLTTGLVMHLLKTRANIKRS